MWKKINIKSFILKIISPARLVPYIFLLLGVSAGPEPVADLLSWFWYCPDALSRLDSTARPQSHACEPAADCDSLLWPTHLGQTPSPRHRLEFSEDDGWEGAQILPWASLEKGSCRDEGRRDEALGLGEAASFLPRLWEIRPSYGMSLDGQGVIWKYPGAAVRSRPPLGPMPSCSVLSVHPEKV